MHPVRQKVAVLLTSHNRREITVASVRAIPAAAAGRVDIEAVLVDAASSDGTADAVRAALPGIHVLARGSDVFWNMGMREAWSHALGLGADFYLWLNDDLVLAQGALAALVEQYESEAVVLGPKLIIVGRVTDPATGAPAYGGYRRKPGLSRIAWRHLNPGESICDTMNGNCVLLPARVVEDVGLLSPRFSHAFGDIDYGLRARRAGYVLKESRDPVGHQEFGPQVYSSNIKLRPAKWKWVLTHPKGVPAGEWLYFCRSHAGPLWPVNFLLRYLKMLG